ncbi:hypothetical protein D3C87_1266530 [compost metagenome]
MPIPGAQDDRVDLFAGAILEMCGLADHMGEQRYFGKGLRPIKAHRLGAIAESNRFGAVLVALRADVFCRVTAANQKQIFALKLARIAEIMGVQYATGKLLQAFEVRRVGGRKVPGGDDDVIEFFGDQLVLLEVAHGDRELAGALVIGNPMHRCIEADVLAHIAFGDAADDVVTQHGAWRVGGNRPAEVFFEGVVGELQAFLGAV